MDSKTQEHIKFDKNCLDDILKGVKTQDDLWGENGVITQLSKALIERMLNAEIETEGVEFLMSVLIDFNNRGVKDMGL